MYNFNHQHKSRKYLFLLVPVIIFAVTLVVQQLWNFVIPEVFGVKAITYWQALALLVLSRILLGNFSPGRRPGIAQRGELRKKWLKMTAEEREKFKEEWKRRCDRM